MERLVFECARSISHSSKHVSVATHMTPMTPFVGLHSAKFSFYMWFYNQRWVQAYSEHYKFIVDLVVLRDVEL